MEAKACGRKQMEAAQENVICTLISHASHAIVEVHLIFPHLLTQGRLHLLSNSRINGKRNSELSCGTHAMCGRCGLDSRLRGPVRLERYFRNVPPPSQHAPGVPASAHALVPSYDSIAVGRNLRS